MKGRVLAAQAVLLAAVLANVADAQVSPPTGDKTLAATISVYVFPAKGQTPDQQSKDEATCYGWAVDNTKTDPLELTARAQQQRQQANQQKAQIDQAGEGAGAKGALAGAAGGALMGEIVDDKPGEGAAAGAVIGGVAARRRAKRKQAEAKAQVDAQTQNTQVATAKQIEDFKKAFSVCLEANGYLVKL